MDKRDWQYYCLFSTAVIGLILFLFRQFLFDSGALLGSVMSDQLNGLGSRFIRDGLILPQWDPSRLGGVPTLDAIFGDAYHPLVFLQHIMDPARAVGMKFVICIILAYFTGSLLFGFLCRNWKTGAVLGLLYALSPAFFTLIYAGHDGKMMVISVLPLALYGLIALLTEGKVWGALIVTVSLIWMVLSSHLQLVYFVLWGAFLYSFYLSFIQLRKAVPLRIRVLRQGLLGLAVAAALLLTAVQIIPPYQYTKTLSVRSNTQKTSVGHAASWSLHQEEVAAVLMPQFLGTIEKKQGNNSPVSKYWGHNAMKINADAPGMLLVLLAFIGLTRRYDRGEKFFWLGGMTLVLIYSVGAHTPFFTLFYQIIPGVKNFRAPAMILFWLPAITGILAALLFREADQKKSDFNSGSFIPALGVFICFLLLLTGSRYAWLLARGPVGAIVVIALGIFTNGMLWYQNNHGAFKVKKCISGVFSGMKNVPKLHLAAVNFPFIFLFFLFLSGNEVIRDSEIAGYFKPIQEILMRETASEVWISFIVGLLCCAAVWFFFQKKYPKNFRYAILLAVGLIDTLSVNMTYIDTVPRKDYIAASHPHIQYVQKEIAKDPLNDHRVLSGGRLPKAFKNNTMAAYGFRSAAGFHDNELNTYRKFRQSPNRDHFLGPVAETHSVSASPFMNIMNIRYLFLPDPDFRVQVYENTAAFERTTLYYDYDVLPDHLLIDKLRKNVYPYQQAIAFAEEPVLNGSVPRYKAPAADRSAALKPALTKGSSRVITSPSPDRLTIENDAPRPGILLFSENYHPYWKARVNGKETPVLKAFTTLIAVEVPQGKSSIELYYQSDAVEASKKLAYIGIFIVLILIGLPFVKAHRM